MIGHDLILVLFTKLLIFIPQLQNHQNLLSTLSYLHKYFLYKSS